MLLHSCPDTVRKFSLRKTQTSTSLTTGGSESDAPRHIITPAVADCRYRAPLSPRLHGTISILIFPQNVNHKHGKTRAAARRCDPYRKLLSICVILSPHIWCRHRNNRWRHRFGYTTSLRFRPSSLHQSVPATGTRSKSPHRTPDCSEERRCTAV